MPGIGWITFFSLDSSHFEFTARLGEGTPTPTAGYGGWQAIARPRRRSLTEWNGNEPLQLDIPILFDAFAEDDGVKIEHDIRQLEKMAGLDLDVTEPPLVQFDSGGAVQHDVHDASQVAWVIRDITWGNATRNIYGNRTRQAVTVHAMEYVEDQVLRNDSPATRRRSQSQRNRSQRGRRSKGARQKTYVVHAGDTLGAIAARKLGSASRWHDIANLNHIRDPKSIKQGQTLRLP